jgi:TRAP-type C4-dicarboxylate transport system substrate-binding protein
VFRRPFFLIAVISFALAGCGGNRVGGRGDTTRTLTLLSPLPNATELVTYASEVDRISGGSLRIHILYAGHAGRRDWETATIHDIQGGRADLGAAGTRAWDRFGVTQLDALNAPLLIDSYQLEGRVLSSPVARRMLNAVTPLGLVGLGILPGPLRKPLGVSHRLVTPADYKGTAIGTQQSQLADDTLRALGARPVRQPETPGLQGLSGLEFQVAGIDGDRLDLPRSHLAGNVNLWPRPFVLVANAKAYSTLTAAQKRILTSAGASVIPKLTAIMRGDEIEAAGNICRRGHITIDRASRTQLAALRHRVNSAYVELDHNGGATHAALASIEQIKRQADIPPASLAPCARIASGRTSGRTPLDGTWRMDTPPSAAGQEGLAENWGHWTFIFDHGHFAITQENAQACTWGYGTYTVTGNQTTWRFTDGGGEAPNNAENKPGEEFSFATSAYHDTLTLSSVHGAISPLNFRARPWHRTSTTPATSQMSRRCPPPKQALAR